MGKLAFCLCENKGADQLRSNCEADQRLCFPRPLIFFRTTPCCELRKVKETSGGPEGDSKSVHTKGKGVGLSEI